MRIWGRMRLWRLVGATCMQMTNYMLISRNATIEERFARFLERHPEVYSEFKRIAGDLLAHGIRHYGAKAIMEVIRFHRAMSGQDAQEPFKINNNYTSRIARKLMDEDERFVDFFEIRELKST